MGTRMLARWIWVVVLAGGCWSSGDGHKDADAGGTDGGSGGNGVGGSGGVAGFIGGTGGAFMMTGGFGAAGIGAEGGFGGDSGSGATGGSAGGFCPDSNPSCSPMNKDEVCTTLLECDLIPRPPSSVTDCMLQLDERCADCIGGVTDDGGVVDCAEAAQSTCTACTLLTQPPTNEAECLAIAAAQPNLSPAYESCICASCLAEYAACVEDDGCWLVMQCAYEVQCTGMSCYAPNTCMAIIDEVGATSISVAIATELGNCSATTCDGL